jgi:DNA-binding transcriptional ArsR family regulator
MNMKKNSLIETSEQIAASLSAIASSQRIAILLAIGNGEACVCHLETVLGWRQAYISQHLMGLRKADILQDRREGRYIFYKLKNTALLNLLTNSASLYGLAPETISTLINKQSYPSCECPQCAPALIPISSL